MVRSAWMLPLAILVLAGCAPNLERNQPFTKEWADYTPKIKAAEKPKPKGITLGDTKTGGPEASIGGAPDPMNDLGFSSRPRGGQTGVPGPGPGADVGYHWKW